MSIEERKLAQLLAQAAAKLSPEKREYLCGYAEGILAARAAAETETGPA